MNKTTPFKAGYVAVIGRPNVGKSTLMNHLLGEKLAITSRKPQTTRQNMLGIYTDERMQIVFADTPGLHEQEPRRINRYMNQSAQSALAFCDVVLHLTDATRLTSDDEYAIQQLADLNAPVIHVINKLDLLDNYDAVMPIIAERQAQYPYADIIPVSALKNTNTDRLIEVIANYLPEQDAIYPPEQLTTADMRFLASELIREKLFKLLHQELPYALTVLIVDYKEEDDRTTIHADILVEREGQKGIVIGKGGKILKMVGEQARKDLESYTGNKVVLKTHVRVSDNWSDNDKAIQQLGLSKGLME